jgi:hypothetical protein
MDFDQLLGTVIAPRISVRFCSFSSVKSVFSVVKKS